MYKFLCDHVFVSCMCVSGSEVAGSSDHLFLSERILFFTPSFRQNDPFCPICRDSEMGPLDVEGIGVEIKQDQCGILCRIGSR